MAKYLNQSPKDWAAQSAAFKKAHPGGIEDLDRTRYVLQPKYDGCHLIVDTYDHVGFSRTGEPSLSCDHIVAGLGQAAPGMVFFGEVYQWNTPFKDISGSFRRQRPQPDLLYCLFDMVTRAEYDAGYSARTYQDRYNALSAATATQALAKIFRAPCVTLEPWAPINAEAFALELKGRGGYDGAVLRDMQAPWAIGDAKNGEVIKVKPVLSLDLAVTGAVVERKPTKLGGYITVVYDGVSTDVGSGLTQDNLVELGEHGVLPGSIAEVECMGLTETGKLREPRFKGWRYDKDKAD